MGKERNYTRSQNQVHLGPDDSPPLFIIKVTKEKTLYMLLL